VVALGVVVVAAMITAVVVLRRVEPEDAGCRVTGGESQYPLSLEQGRNATTIAAVGKLMGMPNHAVTVALAAAFQESNLRNLEYGDRDSVGLFQQRPSQGWGAPEQLLIPAFAAAAFYRELENVDGWEALPVNDAAQRVQRSATPRAYAKWETHARDLAIALTGERPAGFACRFDTGGVRTATPYLPALTQELGLASLDAELPRADAWTAAGWLVGHAERYGISSIALDGRQWTPERGAWEADDSVSGGRLRVEQRA
jgi:hypothetical protein